MKTDSSTPGLSRRRWFAGAGTVGAVAAVAAAFEQQLQAQRDALAQAQDRTQSANKEGLHAAVLAVRTELQALAHAHQLI